MFNKTVWMREYRAKNKEKTNSYSRENYRRNGHKWKTAHNAAAVLRNRKVKLEAIGRYGGQCYCCGESTILFLAVDHINGFGNKERKESGTTGGVGFYRWLKRKGWPDGYQVACHNCNMGRHLNGGVCPHRSTNAENGLAKKDITS